MSYYTGFWGFGVLGFWEGIQLTSRTQENLPGEPDPVDTNCLGFKSEHLDAFSHDDGLALASTAAVRGFDLAKEGSHKADIGRQVNACRREFDGAVDPPEPRYDRARCTVALTSDRHKRRAFLEWVWKTHSVQHTNS